MNAMQRLVLIAIGLGALVMLLYPPFYLRFPNGVVDNLGYHFLFDPPYRSTVTASVHTPTLLVQLLGLLITGVSAWFLVGTSLSRRRDPAAHETLAKKPTLMGRRVEFDPSRVTGSEGGADKPRRGNAKRAIKRVGVTLLAFLASGVLIALSKEYVPATSFSGALEAVVAVGLVFGAWRWSASFK